MLDLLIIGSKPGNNLQLRRIIVLSIKEFLGIISSGLEFTRAPLKVRA